MLYAALACIALLQKYSPLPSVKPGFSVLDLALSMWRVHGIYLQITASPGLKKCVCACGFCETMAQPALATLCCATESCHTVKRPNISPAASHTIERNTLCTRPEFHSTGGGGWAGGSAPPPPEVVLSF